MDPHAPSIVRVAVALSLDRTYHYLVPADLAEQALVGCRVMVPLRKQKALGYILEKQPVRQTEKRLKAVGEVLDQEPLFTREMVPFLEWVAGYYRFPIGRLIQTVLPGGLNPGVSKTIEITARGLEALALLLPRSKEKRLLQWIKENPGKRPPKAPAGLVRTFAGKGWVTLEAREKTGRGVLPLKKWLRPKPGLDLQTVLRDQEPASGARNETEFLTRLFAEGHIPAADLKARFSNGAYLIDKWLRKEVLEVFEAPLPHDFSATPLCTPPEPVTLYAQQEKVLQAVRECITQKSYQTFLLYGVTGSGKTEVYYRAVQCAISRGRQAILLVPEIALAVYITAIFKARLGERVAIYHSGLSGQERRRQWVRIARGEADLVIGARSALFAPCPNLGLIMVDEEHEFAYKQEEAPRYQARDAAVVRGKMQKVPVLLGSGTPAIQSFHNALTKRYQLLLMPERIENRPLPAVRIVDLKEQIQKGGAETLLSPELHRALTENQAAGCQAMLFLNRRGFNRVHLCRFCGQAIRCRNCDLTLTFHLKDNRLACHYCGFQLRPQKACPACGREGMKTYGFGTEKLEQELKTLFPQSRIARMDRDSMRRKGESDRVLTLFTGREIDILLGTQMIAKGYDFPHVTLVGVIAADYSLGFPDFRAGERTFQLLAQVAGRTGRGAQGGHVIIQTFNPQHYAILTAKDHAFEAFYRDEITLRKQLGYPPFCFLACLKLQGTNQEETAATVMQLGQRIRHWLAGRPEQKEIQILGPVEAPLTRLKGQYRWQILIKSKRSALLHQFLDQAEELAQPLLRPSGVTLIADIDPYQML